MFHSIRASSGEYRLVLVTKMFAWPFFTSGGRVGGVFSKITRLDEGVKIAVRDGGF